jgi:hypothetical protein
LDWIRVDVWECFGLRWFGFINFLIFVILSDSEGSIRVLPGVMVTLAFYCLPQYFTFIKLCRPAQSPREGFVTFFAVVCFFIGAQEGYAVLLDPKVTKNLA